MNIWALFLKLRRWKVEITIPRRDKCVICVAPHTSNWDFILGLAAYKSLGRKANFLMKSFWFFFPLGLLIRRLGGIPVKRSKGDNGSLTEQIISDFNNREYMNLAVTPEGTRSRTANWRTGFLYIAYGANVDIQLGVIDFSQRRIIISEEYHPTGDPNVDMQRIKSYYSKFSKAGRYPEKFTV